MSTLLTAFTYLTSTAMAYVPKTTLAKFLFVTVGGSWVTGFSMIDLVCDIPAMFARRLLFHAAASTVPTVVIGCGKLAFKTSYIVVSGTAHGVVVLVKLTGKASSALAERMTSLVNKSNSDDSEKQLEDDWVLMEEKQKGQQAVQLQIEDVKEVLGSIDLDEAEFEIYNSQLDSNFENPVKGSIDDIKNICKSCTSSTADHFVNM